MVVERDYSTKKLNNDTIYAVTQDIVKACCHGASIGSYIVSNDTLFFGVKEGYENEWNYYRAKIYNDRLSIFQAERGKQRDNIKVEYRRNTQVPVLKNIKI